MTIEGKVRILLALAALALLAAEVAARRNLAGGGAAAHLERNVRLGIYGDEMCGFGTEER
jgi:hypothetical protein